MGLRDIFLFALVFGGIPFILRDPRIGVFYWVWLGLMNPQSMSWGLSHGFPFAQLVAITTFIAIPFSKQKVRLDFRPEVVCLALFVVWFTVSTPFAMEPDFAWPAWLRAFKVQIFTFAALALLHSRQDVGRLIWVIALSLGLLGAKGGVYTILGGGEGRVWGPGGFVEDNNQFALALVMTVPLLYYLMSQAPRRWVKWGLAAMLLLTALSILGSHSRGALLAIVAIGFFLWLKSHNKVALALALLLLAPALVMFMPDAWTDRMETITTYQEDASAIGRLTAWALAAKIAAARFPLGGGFEFQTPALYAQHMGYEGVHSMHSIWFQALGDQGFLGLGLFALMWFFSWRTASWVIRNTRGNAELVWASRLAAMIQVSYVGYFVGGAFVNLTYWDMPYYLLVAGVLLRRLVESEHRATASITERRLPPAVARPVPQQGSAGDAARSRH